MNVTETHTVPLLINAEGWCEGVLHCVSPHIDARPQDSVIDLLVIHNISLPPGQFGGSEIIDLFCNRLDTSRHPALAELAGVRVSSHFLIRRDGQIIQFASCLARAWHAGLSRFAERERCNDFSIGIELEGSDFTPFCEPQYQSLLQLSQALSQRYPLQAVCGHQHIAPTRKTDPGPYFDWQRYQAQCQPTLQFPFLDNTTKNRD